MTVQVQRFPLEILSVVLGGWDEAKLDFLLLLLTNSLTEAEHLPPCRPEIRRLR